MRKGVPEFAQRSKIMIVSRTEKDDTQDAVKADEEITHGDRQDQELATRGSRLRAATLGSRPSLLVSGLSDSTGKLSGASSQARRTLPATS